MAVRLFREETAQRAALAAEHAVTAAEAVVETKREALESYRCWRPEEENRRYAAILNQSLSSAELDAFKAGLIALTQAEQKREQELLDAEKALHQCRTQLTDCRARVSLARKDTARLETHREIWNEAQSREATHKEDMELEDFRPAPSMETDQ